MRKLNDSCIDYFYKYDWIVINISFIKDIMFIICNLNVKLLFYNHFDIS